ncbi:MAG: molecular chaperone TorD family protein [Chloroflexi bacterium]|nr:molecular chaperone TorD family protein [Chloroflexota bacterium]
MTLQLLSHLWLHEPNAEMISRAVKELNLPHANPDEIASAYTDLFLLNVYPYGTVYTDFDGELNAPAAQQIADLFEAHNYRPPELNEVGAADHVGLCLGFLTQHSDTECFENTRCLLLEWIPICCLAVEREPSSHPFYRALATFTRDHLLTRSPITNYHLPISIPQSFDFAQDKSLISDDEVRLRDIVRFFLAPARCGTFLSRSRLGQIGKVLGTRLPFGSRFEVAESLFASAGEAEILDRLISTLKDEVEAWEDEYQSWAEKYPAWKPFSEVWLSRTTNATRTLEGMRQMMNVGVE